VRPFILRLSRGALVALVLLLPLKFGTVLNVGEIAFFPVSGLEWVLTAWPPSLFPVFAGGLLLLAVVSGGEWPSGREWLGGWGVWLALLGGALPGLIRTTEWDHALLFVWHLLGLFCLAAAAGILLRGAPRLRGGVLAAVAAGSLLAALSAWHQVVGGGYDEVLAFAERAAREQGTVVSEQMRMRLTQGRASGPFVYPNSLAAHLILTSPVVLLLLWRAGERFRPPALSCAVLTLAGGLALGGALLLSGSRAALVGLAGGVGLAAWLAPIGRRWRLAIAAAGLVFLTAALAVVNRGRTLSSLGARLEYNRASVAMFLAHPATGVGLGEFFPWYMRLKPPAAEETRLPHNAFLLFLGQAGIAGGLAAALWYGWMLALPWSHRPPRPEAGDPWMLACVHAGVAAWAAHALTDFNLEIPGTAAIVALLPVLVHRATPPAERTSGTAGRSAAGVADSANGRAGWPRRLAAVAAVLALTGAWRLPGERDYRRFYDACAEPATRTARLKELADQSARRQPFSPYPGLLLGKAAIARGEDAVAAEALEQALSRAPHRGSIWAALAECRRRLGRTAAAAAAWERAREWSSSAGAAGPPPSDDDAASGVARPDGGGGGG